ncbi:hypothetical protein BH23ACT10_BH23ACT10_02290 [soil metagenome]
MALTIAAVSELADRPVAALTRRDVAMALLRVPADRAAAALPELRDALLAAGNPLSRPFWDSARAILTAIADGSAAVGDVRRWLEATGTEPIQLLADGFVWPDADDRGAIAQEMHARLVEHLESRVAAGAIDPDRLAVDDAEAWRTYDQAQEGWLTAPLPDGRTPMWAVDDEDTDAFLAAWDEADAEAAEILREELSDIGARPCPEAALRDECARLRTLLPDGAWPYDLLRAAGGVDADQLPGDDRELWLALAAGVVACRDDPPGNDDDTVTLYAAWYALDHAGWAGAVAALARSGPGTNADADNLAHLAISYEFATDKAMGDDSEDDGWVDDPADADLWFEGLEGIDAGLLDDDESALQLGFQTVALLWRALGAIDVDERLTPLGWWGLPEATLAAWDHETR